ncbi:polysaccharide deacetylase family protein [Deinococcus soli (ex Cha et al. 2016)]|uniref:polysaccharide deacetylase family protein n=1 Tax=Deinococcus soli (ex Cha et al. 2016) TaxID=1309411 RepID=UPI00069A0CBB|nr:polysaccharide deacetylase family protein [Deinococcus soli (ex Cha et al. 2016)]
MLTSRLRALLLPLALISGAACSHAQARPMVLVYHQVGAGSGASLGIAPQALRQRVETLRRLGYRFVTSSEAARAAPQEKVAVIQFDDGFESVYRLAFPVLRDLGVPGTAYVIWSRLDQPGSLSRAQVRELRAAGWEIGTHSHRHAALADLAPAGLRRELSVPDGEAARCVAYPLNRHDARVRRAAMAQGLSCGVAGGPPALGRPDPLALPAPAITPWDDTLLPLRARWGLDARAPLLLAGVTEPVIDTLLDRGAGEAPAVEPPLTWNPAHYELLGNGLISVAWRGERETRLAWREGRWSVNAAARRGVGRLDGVYTGGSVAFNVAPVTLAAGWDGSGPLLAGAVSLGGYGEVWGRASRLGGAWTWGAGATLIPADYVQISAAHGASGTQLGLRAALPWQDGEGRPLRLGGGYRWGEGAGPFAELEYRVGSYSLAAEVSGAGRFGVKFTSVW